MQRIPAGKALSLFILVLFLLFPPLLQGADPDPHQKKPPAKAQPKKSDKPSQATTAKPAKGTPVKGQEAAPPKAQKAAPAKNKEVASPASKPAPAKRGTNKVQTPPPGEKKASPPKRGGFYHTVKKGQNLFGISRAYHVSIEDLVKTNQLSRPSALQVGQRIIIPGARQAKKVEPFRPLSGRQRIEIARSLEEENNEEGEPDEKSAENGDEGKEEEAPPESSVLNGTEESSEVPTKAQPSPEIRPQASDGDFIWPLINRITSPFGSRGRRMHKGVDIAAPSYHEVVAAADGEVAYAARSRKGLGNAVVLKHDNGFTTVYGHGVVILVKEGDTVRQGEPIMGVGSTGRSTGNHLHFEIRKDGLPLDPLPLMPPTLDELIEGLRTEEG